MTNPTDIHRQIQNLRKMHVPDERDAGVRKQLLRLLEVDADGEILSVPCRFTNGKQTRGIAVVEPAGV